MYLKIVAGEEVTVLDNVRRVDARRDDDGPYLDVTIGAEPSQRYPLIAKAYLMNDRGDTIDTFRYS